MAVRPRFPVSIFVLVFLAVLPCINLMGVVMGATTVALMTMQLASRASQQQTYQQAQSVTVQEAANFTKTGFAHFIKLKPLAGYLNSGAYLYVQSTSLDGALDTRMGANTAVPPPIDPTSNVYEYVVQTDCLVGPFIALNGIPWIKDIPGLACLPSLSGLRQELRNALGVAGVGSTVASTSGSSPTPVGARDFFIDNSIGKWTWLE